MKAPNIFSLSYCAVLLLCREVSSEPQPAIGQGEQYTAHRKASHFAALLADPRHAWWKDSLIKREAEPDSAPSKSASPVALPTKCQYVPENTSPSCDKGCICGTSCDSIYIWNTTRPTPKPQYHICTNWMINHGYQLRAAFENAGFEGVPNRTQCGWQSFTHVTALGVGRGSIDVNGTFDQDHGDAYELARIEEVMRAQYPFVEILIILATLVGPLVLLGAALGWCVFAEREQKFKYKYRRISSI